MPVARVGDIGYSRIGEIYRMKNGNWEEESAKMSDELKHNQRIRKESL